VASLSSQIFVTPCLKHKARYRLKKVCAAVQTKVTQTQIHIRLYKSHLDDVLRRAAEALERQQSYYGTPNGISSSASHYGTISEQ
jgi:hypothetical protein